MITVRVNDGPARTYADDAVVRITRSDFGRPTDDSVSRRPIRIHRPPSSPWWVLENLSTSHPLEVIGGPGPEVVPCGGLKVVRSSLTVVIRGFKNHVVHVRPDPPDESADLGQSDLPGRSTIKLPQLGPKQRVSLAAFLIPYFREFPHWEAESLSYRMAKTLLMEHPEIDPRVSLNVERNVEHVAEKLEDLGFDVSGHDKSRKLAFLVIGRGLITKDDYEMTADGLRVRLPDELLRQEPGGAGAPCDER